MDLAVCARDVKFYQWPGMYFLGAYEVPSESSPVKTISWSSDRKNVLVISNKSEPLFVGAPVKSNDQIRTEKFVSLNNVSCGCFAKINPNVLALGSENGEVSVCTLNQRDIVRYKKLPNGIQNLDFSHDDRHLLAGCFDGNIFLFDTKGRPTASFVIPNSYSLSTAAFSKYSELLSGGSNDGSLAVWNIETDDLLLSKREHTARISDIAFLENTVTTVGTDGFLCLFDLRAREAASKCNLEGALSSLAYFPKKVDLAVSTYNQLRSYDLRNLKTPVKTLLVNNGGHIKKILASPFNTPDKIDFKSNVTFEGHSASGDFSITSNFPSNSNQSTIPDIPHPQPIRNEPIKKTFKSSEVKELNSFVDEYLKHLSANFSERLARSFYALRINTSKQFICMGARMDVSWHNFVAYLRCAGTATSSSESDKASTEIRREKTS